MLIFMHKREMKHPSYILQEIREKESMYCVMWVSLNITIGLWARRPCKAKVWHVEVSCGLTVFNISRSTSNAFYFCFTAVRDLLAVCPPLGTLLPPLEGRGEQWVGQAPELSRFTRHRNPNSFWQRKSIRQSETCPGLAQNLKWTKGLFLPEDHPPSTVSKLTSFKASICRGYFPLQAFHVLL